jgi:hypothetical protein
MSRWLIAVLVGILGLGIVSLAIFRYEELVHTKEANRTAWMDNAITPDCKKPQNDLKILECKSKLDEQERAFEKHWQYAMDKKPN